MKDLKYYKDNCEEDYLHTPISVLRYITELEKRTETKPLIIDSVSKRFSYDQMIEASRYGYDYRHSTSFPNKSFDDNCKNNTKQWMTCI